MQQKTSSKQFLKYGKVYDQPHHPESENMTCTDFTVNAKRNISQLYCFLRKVLLMRLTDQLPAVSRCT